MNEIDYADAPIPVRDDLPAAHTRAWRRLAAAGSWWTGAQHVAIAAEVRNAWGCALCIDRKDSISPYTLEGTHDQVSDLAEEVVDAVHRITTDCSRLTDAWYEQLLDSGQISEGQYVELLDVVVTVVAVDRFCRGIGVPLRPLPEPVAGEPSHYRPAAAVRDVSWVPMIPNGQATGEEAGLYGAAGETANVVRALSLVPDAVRQLEDQCDAHYLAFEEMSDLTIRRALTRPQIELIASRVASLRACVY